MRVGANVGRARACGNEQQSSGSERRGREPGAGEFGRLTRSAFSLDRFPYRPIFDPARAHEQKAVD